jgi:hypothetical protein
MNAQLPIIPVAYATIVVSGAWMWLQPVWSLNLGDLSIAGLPSSLYELILQHPSIRGGLMLLVSSVYIVRCAHSMAARPSAYWCLLLVTTVLMLTCGYSFAATHVFMPAGLVSCTSAVVYCVYGIRAIREA